MEMEEIPIIHEPITKPIFALLKDEQSDEISSEIEKYELNSFNAYLSAQNKRKSSKYIKYLTKMPSIKEKLYARTNVLNKYIEKTNIYRTQLWKLICIAGDYELLIDIQNKHRRRRLCFSPVSTNFSE